MNSEKKLLPAGTVLQTRYTIEKLLGCGGWGAVYKASYISPELARIFGHCAIKEMNHSPHMAIAENLTEMFFREAQTLVQLKHEHIPRITDYFKEHDRYYLVMEYIEGKDLETIMRGYGGAGVPPELVIEWSRQILDVLDYLHNQSPPVIYRDLKPANIMLRNSDGMVNLIDFGIARTVTPGNQSTMTGIGTPVYAPKELLMGKPETGSDIYSLGATMHSLLTGIVPTIPCDFKPLRTYKPELPAELEKIVMTALEMEIENRYASAKEMKSALEELPPVVSVKQKTFKTDPLPPVSEPTPSASSVGEEDKSSYPEIPSGSVSQDIAYLFI